MTTKADLRICRKCRKKIPWRITFEDKTRNLKNRKFCLTCSPFKGHNTRPDDPAIPPRAPGYKGWTQDRKAKYIMALMVRAIKRKTKLIEMAGGECLVCGYDKCHRAMAFYHRQGTQKKFQLSMEHLWAKKWSRIITEFKKCDLLCVRCLAEAEFQREMKKPDSYHHLLKY